MRKALIVDLDGTLFNIDHRLHYLEEKEYDKFFAAVDRDVPNRWCVELVEGMYTQMYDIIFVSGRNKVVEKQTRLQLTALGFGGHALYMRPEDSRISDVDLKRGIYRGAIKDKYDLVLAVEDRKRVAKMYREEGVVVLHCAEGNF
jgi:hypothetical protein